MLFIKRHGSFLITFSVLALTYLFIFRSLLFNISINLPDWNDYPLYVWILFQNITHLKALSLVNFFNGGIFYPLTGVMLFSDLFLPQSLVGLLLSTFISNPILVFNIVFFLSLLLNIGGAYFLWRNFTKSQIILFFATLTTVFSAYFFLNRVHFQIASIWPFLFGLGLITQKKLTVKNALLVSLAILIQFFSGIYFGVFLMVAIGLWYSILFLKHYQQKKELKPLIKHALILSAATFILVGPLVFSYFRVKQQYQAVRHYGEYVTYSAQSTDYLFPAHLSSLVNQTGLAKKWARFGSNAGLFPGLVVLGLATAGFFTISKNRISFKLSSRHLFFASFLFIGFIFSLGPRLKVNGAYSDIPLPYHLLLKMGAIFEVIRVTSRWSIFFFLGLTYFSIQALERIKKKQLMIVASFSLLFAAELVPLQLSTETRGYYPKIYEVVLEQCESESKVLLEYPMTQSTIDTDIVTNLSYRTQMMLASVHHQCQLINGYTGYIPESYQNYESELLFAVVSEDENLFWKLIRSKKVDLIKLNKNEIFSDQSVIIESWLKKNDTVQLLFDDADYSIVNLIDG